MEVDTEDHEARSAMHELFRAEEIKMGDEDLLERIGDEIDRKVGILTKIRGDLPNLVTIDMGDDDEDDEGIGTSGFEDFLTRIRKKEADEQMKTHESPTARRSRLRGA
jgi:hypothetical protein